jgi:hypothetical protein
VGFDRVPPKLRVLGGSNCASFHPRFGGEVRQRLHSGETYRELPGPSGGISINVGGAHTPLYSTTPIALRSDHAIVAEDGTTRGGGYAEMNISLAVQWAVLDGHFRRHVKQVNRFREASCDCVIRMWASQTNEDGTRLSQFEREALIERHCELFGTWPE